MHEQITVFKNGQLIRSVQFFEIFYDAALFAFAPILQFQFYFFLIRP